MKQLTVIFILCLSTAVWAQEKSILKDTINLDEVLVKATRVDEKAPFVRSNVTKEEIESRNLGQDIPVLLNFLPNVVSTSDAGNGIGYTGIRVRGSDATRVNVTINGIPLNDSESHGVFWVNLPDFATSTPHFDQNLDCYNTALPLKVKPFIPACQKALTPILDHSMTV